MSQEQQQQEEEEQEQEQQQQLKLIDRDARGEKGASWEILSKNMVLQKELGFYHYIIPYPKIIKIWSRHSLRP